MPDTDTPACLAASACVRPWIDVSAIAVRYGSGRRWIIAVRHGASSAWAAGTSRAAYAELPSCLRVGWPYHQV